MNGAVSVSDFLSNLNDQVVNSARLMMGAKQRQKVFEAIYKGQKQEKTVREIMMATGLSQIRVLNEGQKLGPLVEKIRNGFRKNPELAPLYKKILALAKDKKRIDEVPTKVSPRMRGAAQRVNVTFTSSAGKALPITVDEIESFSKISRQRPSKLGSVAESSIKNAFAAIAGEGGKFKDWGGEKSDLYTNKFRVKGKRRPVAIAFKGKGTSGKLVPAKMGKNGDQIDRLFDEPAEVFLVVYCGQIDSSVVSQMHAFAIAKKAMAGQKVYFGVIDNDDLGRMAKAYPKHFKTRR